MYGSKTFRVKRNHPSLTHELKGTAFLDAVHDYYEEKDGVMRTVLDLADEHGCLMVFDANGTTLLKRWYLHPSLRVDGYQLSKFDELGPVMHDNVGHDPHELSYELPDFFEVWWKE